MSLLHAVLDESRRGLPPEAIAIRLGVDRDLVAAALDHWVRVGEATTVTELGLGCAGCAPAAGCASCPVLQSRPD